METSVSDLDRVQRWMKSVITHPDGIVDGADASEARRLIDVGGGNLESVVTRSKALNAAERLAIYGNAYYARLLDCVGEVFPVLKRTLGEDVFDGFVFGYLQSYPSTSYTLHHLGRHFVKYLTETSSAEDAGWSGFLIDLARLEWEIYDVFDGPGLEQQEAFNFDSLLDFPPEDWIDLYLKTAPTLRLLTVDYPVNDHYTEVRATDGELEMPFPDKQRQYLAISRRDYIVRRYSLNFPQFELLRVLHDGESLGEALAACAAAAESDPAVSLERDLKDWFGYWGREAAFIETAIFKGD